MEFVPMTTGQVARRLEKSTERVRQLEREGRIKSVRTTTGLRLFDPADVDRLAAELAAKAND